MKIKTISRTEEDYTRKSKHDITKVHRNRDPSLHPFERAREYTKAVMATKLDKIFAKPFIGALDGHTDGVYCSSSIRNKNVPFISGACDGELKVWDLSRRVCFWSAIAHAGFVRGIAPDTTGSTFYTCGDDKMIKQWALEPQGKGTEVKPINSFLSPHSLTSIDHHWADKQFATSGEAITIWDTNRPDPIHSYKWGADSVLSVKFNPAEASLLASTASDRSVCLYDLRVSVPMRKFVLPMVSNKVCWNPMEPFNFILANEDHNIYSFDMRKLDKAVMIHKDHVSAVLDVAFSPTGREFVSGSYDRTVRIFKTAVGRSRDGYHTKRMQRIFCVNYSADARFVLSGSDDTNIRIWKAEASQTVGVIVGRKERSERFNDSIKKRFAHMPEIKRISNDKKMPNAIKKASSIKHIQATSERRKQENRKNHSKAEDVHMDPERKRVVLKEFK
jgi:DDB1- and CUL4-associated factor 13